MLVKPNDLPLVGNRFNAHVVWMAEAVLLPGKLYNIKLGTHATNGSVKTILHRVDVNTLEQQAAEQLALNEIGLCELTLSTPVAFDAYSQNRATGAFIIIDRLTNVTVGAGMITGAAGSRVLNQPVSAEERARRLGQSPQLVSCLGSAADALSRAVERQLFDSGRTVVVLNDQNVPNSEERRRMAGLLLAQGLVVVTTGLGDADIALLADTEDAIPAALSRLNGDNQA